MERSRTSFDDEEETRPLMTGTVIRSTLGLRRVQEERRTLRGKT